jgi:iron complex outermembrane receptor protein
MTNNKGLRYVAAALLLLGAPRAAHAEPSELDVGDVRLDALLERDLDDQLGSTEAISRKAEQVLTAPAAMSRLSRDEIGLSGAHSVPDLLRWVPGVQVFRNAPGNYIVSMRGTGGLGGNNVVVMVNGVPINSPLDASVDWDLMPVNVRDIERIEIVRGPVGTIYGANAYTGVINIMTSDAYEKSTSSVARLEGGSDTNLGTLAGLSGRYTTSGEAARVGVFGMGEIDGTGRSPTTGDTPAAKRIGFLTDLELPFTKQHRLVLNLGASRSTRSSLDHLVQDSNPQTRSLVLGSLRWVSSDLSGMLPSLELWARSVGQFTETDAASYSGFSYADTRSSRSAVGAAFGIALAPELNIKLGGEGDLDWVDAPYLSPGANDRLYSGYGFHGTVEYSLLDRLHLTLGGRGDVPTGNPALQFSYRGSLVYAAEAWAVRLAAASGYRSPSYVELGGRFTDRSNGLILLEGDPKLSAPSNDTLELGLIAAPHATLHVMPTVYVSRLRDVIVEDFEPLVRRTFRNDPVARNLVGTELEVDWEAREDLALTLNVGTLHWLGDGGAPQATVGVDGQTSTWVVGMRAHGSSFYERLAYGLGVNYASERSFALRAGIPTRIIDQELLGQTHAFVSAEYSLGVSVPLWVAMRAFSALPHDEPESPMPAANLNTTSAVLSLIYREE